MICNNTNISNLFQILISRPRLDRFDNVHKTGSPLKAKSTNTVCKQWHQFSYLVLYLIQFRNSLATELDTCNVLYFEKMANIIKVDNGNLECVESRYDQQDQATNMKQKNSFDCEICELNFNCKQDLTSHIKTVHQEEKDFKASTHIVLDDHINNVHLKVKEFKCTFCDFKTISRTSLQSHVKGIHLQVQKEKQCETCDYKGTTNQQMQEHTKAVHLKIKNWKCELCEFTTNFKHHLKAHMKANHSSEKDNTCDFCEYKSRQNCLSRDPF